jgi:hypothetical protein
MPFIHECPSLGQKIRIIVYENVRFVIVLYDYYYWRNQLERKPHSRFSKSDSRAKKATKEQ